MSSNFSIPGCDTARETTFSSSTFFVVVSYVVLIPLIVIGNGLVVTAFIIHQKLRTATNIFICGLGLSDLLIGVFSVPYWAYISSLNSLVDAFCTPLYRVFICVDIGTGCASILQLTSIALERLYFTIAPLQHRRLSRMIYWIMLAVAWIFSIFAAGMQPIQAEGQWHDEYSIFLMVTCFLFPLFIIIAVYSYIFKVSRDQSRRRTSTNNRIGSTGANIKEFHMFVTVSVITGVFVIAWAPFFITTVIANFCPECITRIQSDHLVRFVKWMQYSSSAINPYIYAYRNAEVRSFFKKVLCENCLCSFCQSRNLSDQTPRYYGDNNNGVDFKENHGDDSVFEACPTSPNVNQNDTNDNECVFDTFPKETSSSNSENVKSNRDEKEKRFTYRDRRGRKENRNSYREQRNFDRIQVNNDNKLNDFSRSYQKNTEERIYNGRQENDDVDYQSTRVNQRGLENDHFPRKHHGKLENERYNGRSKRNEFNYPSTRVNQRELEQFKTCRQTGDYEGLVWTDSKRKCPTGRHSDNTRSNRSAVYCNQNGQNIRSFDNQVDTTNELTSTYV